MNDKDLIMRFDPGTILHLGVQMYTSLPAVLAELVANAYDADATEVTIKLFDEDEKSIMVIDNGTGMSFDELNNEFLVIGRNRRHSKPLTEKFGRPVIGRKGLGKLAFFGIANKIRIVTVKNGIKNAFLMDYSDIEQLRNKEQTFPVYKPKILVKDEKSEEPSGTSVKLSELKRKYKFNPKEIAESLAKTFQIFDEENFNVQIEYNNTLFSFEINNEWAYKEFDNSFKLIVFEDLETNSKLYSFAKAKNITGKLFAGEKTVASERNGVALFSRGKLVNRFEFYGLKATSVGYKYITGYLNVDFIDDFEEDMIATNRQSLLWEKEELEELKNFLQNLIKGFYTQFRKHRSNKAQKDIQTQLGIDLNEWFNTLPKHEKSLAQKIIGTVINSEGIDTDKKKELVNYTVSSFQFEAFKDLASEIAETNLNDLGKLLSLFKEWEFIEAREMSKLAMGRLKTIETFERLIAENALEVQVIHPFFKKFPWILDPRINMFRHEVQYATLLKENYPEEELNEQNRRIDFLCTSVSNHKFIIELKRPHHRISYKDIEQAKDYRSFLENYLGTDSMHPNKVVAYIVGGKINNDDRRTRDEIDTQMKADKVYVKTYMELLTEAKNYHEEFIKKYEEFRKTNG